MKVCMYCKRPHNPLHCPFYLKTIHAKTDFKTNFAGASPAPFIGHYGYPFVNIGFLTPPNTTSNAWEYDAPKHWAKTNTDIPTIVKYRMNLVNSRSKETRIQQIVQEIGMAQKPVEVEIQLKNKPSIARIDPYTAPTGATGEILKAQATSNPSIPTKIDKTVSDTDLKATLAIQYLHKNGFDENYISKLLSVGTLGIKRKFVPTRWSITAIDDTISKRLIETIREYSQHDYAAYFGDYLGNYYLILTIPSPWSYELFETHIHGTEFSTDYESTEGRKDYAQECAGGYYTVRLALAEHLTTIKKTAATIAIRVITDEYTTPLGVWVTREATRKTLANQPIKFASKELMINYAKQLMKMKFGLDINPMLNKSRMLRAGKQLTLDQRYL
jgi:DNA repair protein NreA